MADPQVVSRSVRAPDRWLAPALLLVAGLGWWWSAVTAGEMTADMSAG